MRVCISSPKRRQLLKVLLVAVVLLILYYFIKYFVEVSGLKRQLEPGALKGFFHCKVNETALNNISMQYLCDFNPQPNTNGPIIVTFINSAWLSLAQNWVCSAKKVGIVKNIFLVSFEPRVCSHFPDVKCYEHPHVTVRGTAFGKAAYGQLVTERTKVILRLLSCGQRLSLVDADVTFLRDPMNHLEREISNKDIVFQADSVGVSFVDSVLPLFFNYVCGGFIYMRPTRATKQLWLSVLQYQLKFFWNDQAGLNVCLRHHTQAVVWDTLDSRYFPNGRQFFYYKESDVNEVFIVHANHLQGKDKHIRMIGSRVWCYQEYAEVLCSDNLTYHSRCGVNVPADLLPRWCREFVDTCHKLYRGTVA